jgi:hypothetical protein
MVYFNDKFKPKPDAEFQLNADDVITIYLSLQFLIEHPVWEAMIEAGMDDKISQFLEPYLKMQNLFKGELDKVGVELPKPISDLFK